MLRPALACLMLLASPALAQKIPYAGPQPTGKPPPLGAPGFSPFDDQPRTPRPPGNDAGPLPTGRAVSSGTGFVVATGRIMTNNHVVNECGRMVARTNQGRRVAARVLATDQRRDLALLDVPGDTGPPLSFRNAPPVQRGEAVVTYGFPLSGVLSSGPQITTGDISALAGLRDNPANFQISAPVQPGSSGGPLLDSNGNVIGVIVSKLNAMQMAEMTGGDIPQNVNFAVKGAEAIAFLKANNVDIRLTSSAGPDKKTVEIGLVADPSTLYLQCFR